MRSRSSSFVLVAALGAVACHGPIPEGRYPCAPATDCPPSWFCRADHRCWRTAEVDATIPDAEVAADAGACGACGDGSVCSTSGSADVGSAPAMCVQCVDDSQCAAFDAGVPDAGGIDGGGLATYDGHAICDNFACVVGCRHDGHCRTNVCRPDHRCSAYPSANFDTQCVPCDDPRNCDSGLDCVETFYGGASDGGHCLRRATGTTCMTPYMMLTARSIVPGSSDMPYCAPSTITTCDAMRANRRTCSSPSDCPSRGALCARTDASGPNTCTVACRPAEALCDPTLICTGTGSTDYCVF